MQKNFHLHDNVHGMEKLGAMEFIQSMFIQCDHGIVKVFPNWTGADAKFENLRAKGCFLVSAEMKDGKVVHVEVKSEKGGRNSLGAFLRKSRACGGVVMRKLNRIVLNRFV